MDGCEVARTIKHESPGTPVVALTDWGTFLKEDGTLPAPVDGILNKPPRLSEIRVLLRRVVRKSDTKAKQPPLAKRVVTK